VTQTVPPSTQKPLPDTPPSASGLLRLFITLAVIVGFAMLTSVSIVIVIAAIIVMVFFHELGHYLTAKWAGMKVTEFFIGFGPKLWSFRRGETEYGVKPIPAGAYVKIIGMHNLEEVDPAEEHRTYRQQPYWRRMSVALAGSTMHFIMAFVLLYALLVFAGVENPDSQRWSVAAVTDDSPAAKAGIETGDRVVSIDGTEVTRFEDLRDLIGNRIGEESTVLVERDGQTFERTFTIEQHPEAPDRGFLGVAPDYPREREGVFSGVVETGDQFGYIFKESGKALFSFFSPSALGDYAEKVTTAASEEEPDPDQSARDRIEDEGNRFLSPVGAVRLGADMADSGWAGLLGFLVMINIFVGIFNLVPLLPLDGGHVAIATYEKIRSMISGRRYYVDVAKLLPLTYAVVVLLVTIGVTALYLDLIDPISLR
jgi:membrane-associated protease RseP (regulator of RpoE activity)